MALHSRYQLLFYFQRISRCCSYFPGHFTPVDDYASDQNALAFVNVLFHLFFLHDIFYLACTLVTMLSLPELIRHGYILVLYGK